MTKINSELYSYESLVYARAMEIETKQPHIHWSSYTYNGKTYEVSSVQVGQFDEKFIKMGFRQDIIYHRDHFEQNMMAYTTATHAHNVNIADMLSLPKALNEPVAIIKDKEGLLHFLAVDRDPNGYPVYRQAIVSPHDFYDGTTQQYGASRVITFYNIEQEEKFFKILNNSELRGDILYFDPEQYSKCNPTYQTSTLLNKSYTATQIRGHFTPRENVDKLIAASTNRARQAAELTMIKAYDDGYLSYKDHYYEPFETAIKILNSKEKSIDDLKIAKHLIDRACKLVRDREIVEKTRALTDPLIAKYYCELIQSPQIKTELETAVERVDNMDVLGLDVDDVYDAIEEVEGRVPTLKNIGIEFSDKMASHPDVIAAYNLSHDIANETSDRLNAIADKHIDRIEEIGEDGPGNH